MARLLLIWLSWPLVLFAIALLAVLPGNGFTIDLLHGWLVPAVALLLPPLLATIVWGRK